MSYNESAEMYLETIYILEQDMVMHTVWILPGIWMSRNQV